MISLPTETNLPRPNRPQKGMIRPSNGAGMSGNQKIDELVDDSGVYWEQYDGERWVRIDNDTNK